MEGSQSSPLPRSSFSFSGLPDSPESDTELVSSQESPTYDQLRNRESPLYQNIQQSPSGAREKGPTYIVFEGPAPCEAPVTLKSGETGARGKVRSFFDKVTVKQRKSSKFQFSPDPYVASRNVTALHGKTFSKFLRPLDAVLVLFYNPFDDNCRWARLNMREVSPSLAFVGSLHKRSNLSH